MWCVDANHECDNTRLPVFNSDKDTHCWIQFNWIYCSAALCRFSHLEHFILLNPKSRWKKNNSQSDWRHQHGCVLANEFLSFHYFLKCYLVHFIYNHERHSPWLIFPTENWCESNNCDLFNSPSYLGRNSEFVKITAQMIPKCCHSKLLANVSATKPSEKKNCR